MQHLTGPHIGHLLLTEKGLAADTTKERHHHVVVRDHYTLSFFHGCLYTVLTW